MSTTTTADTYTREAFEAALATMRTWRDGYTDSTLAQAMLSAGRLLELAHAEALEMNELFDRLVFPTQHTSTPTVSLVKAYVPAQAPIVGRCDSPVSTPTNRTNLTAWDAWWFRSLLSHNGLDALHSVIQHSA